jgi:hypothetical protein
MGRREEAGEKREAGRWKLNEADGKKKMRRDRWEERGRKI